MYRTEIKNNHLIIKFLGLKFSFKLEETVYTYNDIIERKDLILDQKLYNFYKNIEGHEFSESIIDRIDFDKFNEYIQGLKIRFKKEVLILSDSKHIPKGFNVIDIENILDYSNENYIFVVAYTKDYIGRKAIENLTKHGYKYYSISQAFPLARYFHTDEDAYSTLACESINNESWHFCPVDFENIFQAINITKNLEGDFVEIGTFRGDSASATLNYMKRKNIQKRAYFLDTFIGFDYEEAYKSEDAQWQNTHKETSFEMVRNRLSKYGNATVVQSNIITNELPNEIEKICVANIDVDMYEAVKAALYKVKDKVVKNGIIIAEDYGHTPALIGAQKAVHEFLKENPNDFIPIYMASGQMFLIKK